MLCPSSQLQGGGEATHTGTSGNQGWHELQCGGEAICTGTSGNQGWHVHSRAHAPAPSPSACCASCACATAACAFARTVCRCTTCEGEFMTRFTRASGRGSPCAATGAACTRTGSDLGGNGRVGGGCWLLACPHTFLTPIHPLTHQLLPPTRCIHCTAQLETRHLPGPPAASSRWCCAQWPPAG